QPAEGPDPVEDPLQQLTMLVARDVQDDVEADDRIEGGDRKVQSHDVALDERSGRHLAPRPLHLASGDVDACHAMPPGELAGHWYSVAGADLEDIRPRLEAIEKERQVLLPERRGGMGLVQVPVAVADQIVAGFDDHLRIDVFVQGPGAAN